MDARMTKALLLSVGSLVWMPILAACLAAQPPPAAAPVVVYRGAWDAAHSSPPALMGVPFDKKFGPDAHGHADHYELHVWLYRRNPLGIFAPWNPKVRCS